MSGTITTSWAYHVRARYNIMIHVIGIGSGGRKSLGEAALSIIGRAALLVGGRRHLAEFPESRARKVAVTGSLDEVARSISEEIKGNGRGTVAVLATGDPLLYGIAGYIIRKFGKERVEVIPNVSTVQEAFAVIKESSNGVKVVSAHGRGADYSALASVLRNNDRVAIFTDPVNTPAKIAKEMLGRGVGERRAFVCESIGTPDERVVEGTMKTLSVKKSFAPLNVLILINDGTVSAPARSVPGYPDTLFSHSAGMITKEELRVVSLSKLGLDSKSIVWDIGACSGSVAVEAALCAPLGTTWAIEKDKKRLTDIRKNKLRFNVPNLEIIAGVAPACIPSDLPAPDAVFVGGGGKGVAEILKVVSKRVKHGGRVVVNAVTIETAGAAFGFFKKRGWASELVMINLSKAKDVGGLNMLAANNPVFIIKGVRP